MCVFKSKSDWEIGSRGSFVCSLKEAIAIVSRVRVALSVTRIDSFI